MMPWNRARAVRRPSEATIARDRAVRPARHVATATREGRSVLLDTKRERYFGLDEVGTSIWALLGEGRSVPQIVDGLEGEFDAPRDRLERDTTAFLNNLLASNLVERS